MLRVSGPEAGAAIGELTGGLPEPRRASLRRLRGADGATLDRALVLWFPGPGTATGEDLGELHLHGGRAVVEAVAAALAAVPGLRQAMPGEFTRRAVDNGRLDLAQAEGLADLLEAETEDARRAALGAAEGAVTRLAQYWTAQLNDVSAVVEASLDWSDEGDVAADVGEGAAHRAIATATALADEMAAVLAQPSAERLRDGVRVVLAGPPNAGKSTLLNLLAGREAAIASPIAGTTRDVVEAPVRRGGRAWLLQDTAGLAERTADPVEAAGIERARAAAAVADIVLWLGDDPAPAGAIWLYARADEGRARPGDTVLDVSRDDPASVVALWEVMEAAAATLFPRSDAATLGVRQRALVVEAEAALRVQDDDPLLIAEALRLARRALARMTGADATEQMLDALFGRFCIGK